MLHNNKYERAAGIISIYTATVMRVETNEAITETLANGAYGDLTQELLTLDAMLGAAKTKDDWPRIVGAWLRDHLEREDSPKTTLQMRVDELNAKYDPEPHRAIKAVLAPSNRKLGRDKYEQVIVGESAILSAREESARSHARARRRCLRLSRWNN